MHPRFRNKNKLEVSEKLEVFEKSGSLIINGFTSDLNLNKYDVVLVKMGKIEGYFLVKDKELISKRILLEEHGYWANKIGKNQDKMNDCDFSNIICEIVTDEEKLKSLNRASSLT